MEIPRGRRVSKAKIFKGNYEQKLEFSGGWREVKPKSPPWERCGYFLEQHIQTRKFHTDHIALDRYMLCLRLNAAWLRSFSHYSGLSKVASYGLKSRSASRSWPASLLGYLCDSSDKDGKLSWLLEQ